MPLTFHYLLVLAQSLHNDFGFSKHALFTLSFIRMLLIAPTSHNDHPVRFLSIFCIQYVHDLCHFVYIKVEAGESVLALTQLNVLSILYSLNLHSVANKIPTLLTLHAQASAGGVGHPADSHHNSHPVTIASYITEFIKKQKVSPELKPPEPIPDRNNPFGFTTWTPNVNSSIVDARMQLLQVNLTIGLI